VSIHPEGKSCSDIDSGAWCHGAYRKVDVEDWIIHADNDEFHYYGGKSAVDFLEEMERKGFNEVRGQYVDRVAESGELTHIQTEPNLFAQYALQCQVIKNVAGGRDFKTMAYKVGRCTLRPVLEAPGVSA